MKTVQKTNLRGFTLIEIIVAIAITLLLGSFVYPNILKMREDSRVMDTGMHQKELTAATEAYFRDMGFYPPDVNRGWDPGFERSLPWNPDGQTDPGIDCSHCPADWQTIVAEHWAGPYMQWPRATPFGGRYDYNYWPEANTRYGCTVPAGIYAGAQGDYSNNHTVPDSAEQKMVDKGIDADNCVNGEGQLLLWRL